MQTLYGRHVIEEALLARRRELSRVLLGPGAVGSDWRTVIERAESLGVSVDQCTAEQWRALAHRDNDIRLQRCVLEAGPLPEFGSLEELCKHIPNRPSGKWILALDGVEDPQNVGSLARVAETAGVQALVLTDRRAPPLSPAVARASAGAIEWLLVARVTNLVRALKDLQNRGFWVLAADPEAGDVLYDLPDELLRGDLVVVLGSEGKGLRKSVRSAVDHLVRLPMRGKIASLNVSAAGAVVFYEMARRSRIFKQ